MERLQQLIGKLNEQFEEKADPTQLLVTTQLIEKELLRLTSATAQVYNTSKVAVVMPNNGRSYNNSTIAALEEVEIPAEKPVVAEPKAEKPARKVETFDPLREIPTLSHQAVVKELNEGIASAEY